MPEGKVYSVMLKEKFYRTAIRSALLYDTECWAITRYHAQKMSVVEMHMLRWMCGNTRIYKVRNEDIRTCLLYTSPSPRDS